jgi:hypothetical protein
MMEVRWSFSTCWLAIYVFNVQRGHVFPGQGWHKMQHGSCWIQKNIAFESLNQIVLCNIRQLGFACWVIGNWGLIPWCPT